MLRIKKINQSIRGETRLTWLQKCICNWFKIVPQTYYVGKWTIEVSYLDYSTRLFIGDVIKINENTYKITDKLSSFEFTIANNDLLTHIPEVSGEGVRLFSIYGERG